MPVTLFACPPDKPTYGQAHDPEHCVTSCMHQCYSPFLLTALYGTNQRNHHKGRYVSATALPGCKRRLKNERQVDYAEYPQNLYASFRGSITHEVIEQAMETKFKSGRTLTDLGFVAEWRMLVGFCLTPGHGAFRVDPDLDIEDVATYAQTTCPKCDVDGVPGLDQKWIFLGGTLDGGAPVFDLEGDYGKILVMDGVAHYKLSDIKTMKEFALTYFIKGDPKNTLHPQIKDDYVWQARVYTYLAKHAQVPAHLSSRGIQSIQMVRSDIQAFAMGEAPWTGGGTFRWRDHYKNPLKDWPMHPIDLGTDAEVEAYILANAPAILDTLVLSTHRGDVRRPDQAWLCADYCAFYATDICPNPQLESDLIEDGSMTKDEAFAYVQQHPVAPGEKAVAPLDEFDTQNIDNFFRKQRGEAPVDKLVKPRKPRKKADE